MIDFLIKSTISLGVLYLVYIFFLSGAKTFKFNRYFLLGSLVFSLAIPFISYHIDTNVVPIIETTGLTSITSTIEQTGELIEATSGEGLISLNTFSYVYVSISLILLLRFGLNLSNIIKTIISNKKERIQNHSFVLVIEQVLPHTFFNYIMVSKDDYINDRIDEALIQHEVTHCKQWHSLDILFIELIKVFLWINPFVWLFKKPIQLNHEFLADNAVLANQNINRYQNILINIVLGNNSGLLISNFNFSLTKQRIEMMSKHYSPVKGIFGNVTAIIIILAIGLTISCNQETTEQNSIANSENEWWQPILKVHGIEPTAYNNFDNVFEMGIKNSITNGIVTLEDANIIIKTNAGYAILKSPMAYHDIMKNTISSETGTLRFFKLNKSALLSEADEEGGYFAYENLNYQIGDAFIVKATKLTHHSYIEDDN